MQLILKGGKTHFQVDGDSARNAVNLKFICECLDINYSSLNTLINRGMSLDDAIDKLVNNKQ